MKKISKKAKRRLLFSFSIFLIAFIALGYSLIDCWTEIVDNKTKEQSLSSQYESLLSEEEELKSEVSKLEDPNYVAKYVREKYMYTKDGEKIIKIIK